MDMIIINNHIINPSNINYIRLRPNSTNPNKYAVISLGASYIYMSKEQSNELMTQLGVTEHTTTFIHEFK